MTDLALAVAFTALIWAVHLVEQAIDARCHDSTCELCRRWR